MAVARLLLLVGLAALSGFALLSRLSTERRSGPGTLGLSFIVGVLALGLWSHLLLWTRVPLTTMTLLVGAAIMMVSGRWSAIRDAVWRRPPWPAYLLIPAAAFVLYGAATWPLSGGDIEFFYLFKAKSIALHGTIWTDDFLDPDRLHVAHRRVLLLPLLFTEVGLVAGTLDGRFINAWMALFQIAAWPALYDLLRSRVPRTDAALATVLYATLPATWRDAGGAISGYPDGPLGYILLFSLAWEKRLGAFLLSAGVLLKDDAMAFVLPFMLVRGIKAALVPGLVAAAWLVTSLFLPVDTGYYLIHLKSFSLHQAPEILKRLVIEMAMPRHWSLLWPMILVVLVARIRKLSREDLRLLLPSAMQFGVYMVVWLIFPGEIGKFSIRIQAMRLLLHVVPMLWVWTVWRAVGEDSVPRPSAAALNAGAPAA